MLLETAILSIISLLGLFAGLSLGFIAPEEIKPLEKYLKLGTWIMSTGIFLALLYTINSTISVSTMIAFFGWLFFIRKTPLTIELLSLCIPFFIAFSFMNSLVVSLLFLCGFPIGTLLLTESVKKNKLTKKKRVLLKTLLLRSKYFIFSYIIVLIILAVF